MENIIKPPNTSELAGIPGILLGKNSEAVHALVLAGSEAKHGGYDEDCRIHVLQLPGQIEWSVFAVPDGKRFPLWRRNIIELHVKSLGLGSEVEEDERIDRDVEDAYLFYLREKDKRLKAAQEKASKLGQFTEDEVWAAAETGKFPPGMTAQHLKIAWYEPRKTSRYIHLTLAHSALHLAASKGHFPPGTTFADLLDFEGKDGEDCVGWLFQQRLSAKFPAETTDQGQRCPINFPDGTTAQALAEVSNAKFGDYLNQAAFFGELPAGTTAADLSKIKQLKITDNSFIKELPFKDYAAPLHFAIEMGNLPPGTSAKDLKLSTEHGPSPWDVALHHLSTSCFRGFCVQNILACPELCVGLRPDEDDNHLRIVKLLAERVESSQELKQQFKPYPHVSPYIL